MGPTPSVNQATSSTFTPVKHNSSLIESLKALGYYRPGTAANLEKELVDFWNPILKTSFNASIAPLRTSSASSSSKLDDWDIYKP